MKVVTSILPWRLLFPCMLLYFIGCSNSFTGGSGTEVSAILGKVVDERGVPVECAYVKLRPSTFINDSTGSSLYCATHSLFDTVTGQDGSFRFEKILVDNYTVEVSYNDTLGCAIQVQIAEAFASETLSALSVLPLAKLTGNVNIYADTTALIIVQAYGLDRSVVADKRGSFNLMVPAGQQKLHIAAYSEVYDSQLVEFDEVDISLTVLPGENRDAGSFQLRSSPPCQDGKCDSMVVRLILDESDNEEISVASVITTSQSGRITELNLRGLAFPHGINFNIIKLSELQLLDIGNTQLHSMFPNIGKLQRLETVRVDNNELSFFSSTIGHCTKLRELDLRNNKLTDLPLSVLECNELSILNVSGNQLCSLDSTISAWLDIRNPEWRKKQRCH